MSLNIVPSALNVCAGHSFHFSNSLALFLSCSNAHAITSALGMSGSAATEKHVDSERGEITRTNLESTKKCLRPALSQYLSPRTCSAPVSAATRFRYFVARWAGVHLVCILIASGLLRGAKGLAVGLKRPALSGPLVKQLWIVRELQQRRSNMLGFRHFCVR